jgi:hypothetical protein
MEAVQEAFEFNYFSNIRRFILLLTMRMMNFGRIKLFYQQAAR